LIFPENCCTLKPNEIADFYINPCEYTRTDFSGGTDFKMKPKKNLNRRELLGSAAVSSIAFAVVPRHVLGGPGYVAPSDKVTVANIARCRACLKTGMYR
jgi:hypothetical protein